jgi:hypothetical protein
MPTMRETRRCPACENRTFWNVRTMRERAFEIVDMAVYHRPDGKLTIGTLETFVCARCGLVEWYADGAEGLDGLVAAETKGVDRRASKGRCAGCEREVDRWHLDTMWEGGGPRFKPTPMKVYRARWSDKSEGTFSIDICTGCTLIDWWAHGLEELAASAAGARGVELVDDECVRCGARRALRISRLHDEAAHYNWPVLRGVAYVSFWGGEPQRKGELSLLTCTACGHARWFASKLNKLRDNPKAGVYFIDASAETPAGPYGRG